jgi:hypothetical protein
MAMNLQNLMIFAAMVILVGCLSPTVAELVLSVYKESDSQ